MKVTEKTVFENGCIRYILTDNCWALMNGSYWSYFQINKNGKSRQLPNHHARMIICIKQAISKFETKE
jgi:hypothetical protein